MLDWYQEARLAALTPELAQVGPSDTQRLDWLEDGVPNTKTSILKRWDAVQDAINNRGVNTIREGIDAAMSPIAPETKKEGEARHD